MDPSRFTQVSPQQWRVEPHGPMRVPAVIFADEALLRERTIKEVLHELGHAYGLVHCHDQLCVMRASTYVEEVDLKDAGFCGACAAGIGAA